MQSCTATQARPADPVLADAALPLKGKYYPLGFPVEIATNSALVLEAASASWSAFSKTFEHAPVKLSLGVGEGDSLPVRPTCRARDHLATVLSDAGNFAICDFDKGSAFGWVSQATAAEPAFLRYHFIEAPVLLMLTQLYLAPVHGALVELDGCGVLLCGNSFAGKSTLAYACARAGWSYIGDDGTFLVRDSAHRFGIANPYTIRMRENAPELFPELSGWPLATRVNRKIGLEIFTAALSNIAIASGSLIEHVVFLDRQGSSSDAHLEPYDPEAALLFFEPYAAYGRQSVREAQRKTYRRLLEANLWRLSFRDLEPAVARLARLVRQGI